MAEIFKSYAQIAEIILLCLVDRSFVSMKGKIFAKS